MEKPSEKQPGRRPASSVNSPGRTGIFVAAALPVLACFLGGTTEKWSEGIVAILLGLLFLLYPPRHSFGTAFNIIVFVFTACALTAFLPAKWFLEPAWRVALQDDFGIRLPGTVSPQPWISLGCLLSLVAGLAWLYYMAVLPLERREVRQQLRVLATGVVLLAALSILLYYARTALPFWHNQRGFGPFPNRNQTGNLFGLTSIVVLACGHDDLRNGRKRWIAWTAGFAVLLWALILNFSRAGILIVIIGNALWVAVFVLRKGSGARIALGISALLLLLTALLIFGGQTLERFHLRSGETSGMTTELRWAIFKDALQLIHSSPWVGIGLGNFDGVFAIFRDASLTGQRTIHPESDWFWLWGEMGWLSVVLAAAGAAILIWRAFPFREGTNQRFRIAALIAGVLFLLHGLVDVAGHRIGTAFAGAFLIALALDRSMPLRRQWIIVPLFRVLGFVFLVAGSTWIIATWSKKPLAGGVGVENEISLAAAANRRRDFSETIERTTRALNWAPLRWQLYFLRALGEVGAKQRQSALDDFRRARFLEPNSYELPYEEGSVWLVSDPNLAITAWREALRRVGVQRIEIYRHMLSLATQYNPIVKEKLQQLGAMHHDLAVAYLERANGPEFASALQRILLHDPNLESFSAEEKTKLFSLWSEKGDLSRLTAALEEHPAWLAYGWRAKAASLAKAKDFRGAWELAARFTKAPALPPAPEAASIEQLQRNFVSDPTNYGAAFSLYREQLKRGMAEDALHTLRRVTSLPVCPAYFHYLEAEQWAAREEWERAWSSWEAFSAPRK